MTDGLLKRARVEAKAMSEKPTRIWANPFYTHDKAERNWSDGEWFVSTEPGDPEDEWVPAVALAARIEALEAERGALKGIAENYALASMEDAAALAASEAKVARLQNMREVVAQASVDERVALARLTEDAALAALATERKTTARLREALGVARRSIMEGGGGGVTCTVWVPDDVSPSETLVDHIDAALAAVQAQEGEG